ncbi:hypothetical protein NEPTK9_000993 [Candidatus Neptunochlamydia vexilliferae]|uniref:Type II toxin-antitoxin system mRNA interferase toxin, RelE/StbE family n=2 Tax=Candidatus Neptunichlamydia vexilliferae TaxID=1651774 RepID=A0ABS0AZD3_9BACT|nr:hypothetical protein [Candidatus Neptunochlamydia vexilliferae]
MMPLKLEATKTFERSLKKMRRRGKDLEKIYYVGELLRNKKPLPPNYKNHPLRGNYKGYWECHIEPD